MAITKDVNDRLARGEARYGVLPVSASGDIYQGQLVCVGANDQLVPAEDAAGLAFGGVAYTPESDGRFRFYNDGSVVQLATSGSVAYGDELYVVDDEFVSTVTGSNEIKVGRALEPGTKAGFRFVKLGG